MVSVVIDYKDRLQHDFAVAVDYACVSGHEHSVSIVNDYIDTTMTTRTSTANFKDLPLILKEHSAEIKYSAAQLPPLPYK